MVYVWVCVNTQFVLYTGHRAPSLRGAPPHQQVCSWLPLGAHHVQEWQWAVWPWWVSSGQPRCSSVSPMTKTPMNGTHHYQALPSSSSYWQTSMFLILVTFQDIQVNFDLYANDLWNILMLVLHIQSPNIYIYLYIFVYAIRKFSKEWMTLQSF